MPATTYVPTKTFVKAGVAGAAGAGGISSGSLYDPSNSAMKLHQLAVHNQVVETYEKVCKIMLTLQILFAQNLCISFDILIYQSLVSKILSCLFSNFRKNMIAHILIPFLQSESAVPGMHSVKVKLGEEVYVGMGINFKAAKQDAATKALNGTKLNKPPERKTLKPRPVGITATQEIHELATKKGLTVKFKFIEPYNFEFKVKMYRFPIFYYAFQ